MPASASATPTLYLRIPTLDCSAPEVQACLSLGPLADGRNAIDVITTARTRELLASAKRIGCRSELQIVVASALPAERQWSANFVACGCSINVDGEPTSGADACRSCAAVANAVRTGSTLTQFKTLDARITVKIAEAFRARRNAERQLDTLQKQMAQVTVRLFGRSWHRSGPAWTFRAALMLGMIVCHVSIGIYVMAPALALALLVPHAAVLAACGKAIIVGCGVAQLLALLFAHSYRGRLTRV